MGELCSSSLLWYWPSEALKLTSCVCPPHDSICTPRDVRALRINAADAAFGLLGNSSGRRHLILEYSHGHVHSPFACRGTVPIDPPEPLAVLEQSM